MIQLYIYFIIVQKTNRKLYTVLLSFLVDTNVMPLGPGPEVKFSQLWQAHNVMLSNSWANLWIPSRILSACFFLGTAR